MKRTIFLAAAACCGMLAASVTAWAHHSFAAEYTRDVKVNVTGKVTKIEWMNPHARFYIDVKDDKGVTHNWNFELASPNVLMRQGWTRHSLKVGDTVTVEGFGARAAKYVGSARTVTLADGRKVFASASAGKK